MRASSTKQCCVPLTGCAQCRLQGGVQLLGGDQRAAGNGKSMDGSNAFVVSKQSQPIESGSRSWVVLTRQQTIVLVEDLQAVFEKEGLSSCLELLLWAVKLLRLEPK